MVARRIRVIGVAAGYGAGDPACQDGVEVLRTLSFFDDLESVDDGLAWDPPLRLDPPLPADPVDAVQGIASRLAQRVGGHLAQGDFPLVIGGGAAYGISIDLDALDPAEGPGVGTPVAGGLARTELTDVLALLHGDERLRALEIVEYNPYRDEHFVTARAIHDLCRSLIEI